MIIPNKKIYLNQIRVTNDAKATDNFSGDHGDTTAAETAIVPHHAD